MAGSYAIAYSFPYGTAVKAHLISNLVEYGTLMIEGNHPQLCMFSLQSIEGTCTAVPYYTESNIIDAREWVVLKPRRDWYEIFVKFMKDNT
jgi:hypothetical protein